MTISQGYQQEIIELSEEGESHTVHVTPNSFSLEHAEGHSFVARNQRASPSSHQSDTMSFVLPPLPELPFCRSSAQRPTRGREQCKSTFDTKRFRSQRHELVWNALNEATTMAAQLPALLDRN